MKNPYIIEEDEKEQDKRKTIYRIADKIGVSQMALFKWFFKQATPRKSNLSMLATYMQCSKEEALQAVTRCHDITKAGYKLPFGLIIHKDMLKNSYARFLSGIDPFPKDNSIYKTDRIEYD